MAGHKFRVGEKVVFQASRRAADTSVFTILRVLPVDSQGYTYRIKSRDGSVERVARELELGSLREGGA